MCGTRRQPATFSSPFGEKLLHEEMFCALGSEHVMVLVEGGG